MATLPSQVFRPYYRNIARAEKHFVRISARIVIFSPALEKLYRKNILQMQGFIGQNPMEAHSVMTRPNHVFKFYVP